VHNILGRITAATPSSIYGNLNSATFYPAANLFLINPAGFLFGPNATVNVGGMVSFSSADYLRLTDGKLFNAVPNPAADALLSTAPVAAYGFLGSNPGAITVQGSQLSVTPGQSISLVGGDITIQSGTPDNGTIQSAKLSAPGGQINLASVASPGEILRGTLAQSPNINGQSFDNLGGIQITEQSVIDVSGNGGGSVLIRGSQFLLDNSTISANIGGPGPVTNGAESLGSGIDIQVNQNAVIQNGALIDASVIGNGTSGVQYGGVHVKADHIEVRGIADFDTGNFVFTNIQTNVAPETVGNGGNIILEGNSILVKDAAQIQTLTNGVGNAGAITFKANQNLDIDTGIVQSAAQQTFDQAGNILTRSTGNSGNIEFSSTHGNISITNASGVTAQVVESPGTAGNITMNAPQGNILIADSGFFTYIQPPVNAEGVRIGRAEGSGEVRINANNMQMNGGSIDLINLSAQPAGQVTITLTGSLHLDGGLFAPFSAIHASSVGLLDGSIGGAPSAGLNVRAHDIVLSHGSSIATDTNGPGAAGPLNISAVNLQLTNGGKISSSSIQGVDFDGLPLGPPPSGSAGNITIQGLTGPAQSVLIDGQDSGVFTTTVGTGAGGNINVLANNITLQNGGSLSAATSGTAPSATGGTITVKADTVTINTGGTMTAASSGPGASGEVVIQGLASSAQSILIDGSGSGIFTNTSDTGTGGDIHLSANSVALQNSGELSAATTGTAPSATGGTITVNAQQVTLSSQAVITADTNGIAPAGVIDINTGTLAVNSGGQIRSSSGAETEQLSALAFSLAPPTSLTGGTISIQGQNGNGSQADSVTIDGSGSGIFTQSNGNRPGGDINVLTSQSVAMTNGASVSASSTGTGNAGNININAGNQLAMNNSSVTTEANQASGGAIKITTTPGGTVELTDSTITASVLDGTGGGGSVDIDPQFVILQNSQILANSVFGPGGNISITTNLLLPDTTSVISASSQFGQQGNIVIQSPVSPASGKLVPLGQKPLIATALLSQRCAALAGGNVSSFIVAGRDSLPAEPGGWMSSPLALSISESEDGTAPETAFSSFSELAEGIPLLSLRKLAPAGFLTQSFAGAPSDCTS
jgi:filamentous hemagglutinin family protein